MPVDVATDTETDTAEPESAETEPAEVDMKVDTDVDKEGVILRVSTCAHPLMDKDGHCHKCGRDYDPRGTVAFRTWQRFAVYEPPAGLEPVTVIPESYEEPVTPEPECNCSEDWWRGRERFNVRTANEAHHESCPMFRAGAHYFPLQADGSGVYVSRCIWCGEEKEMRPYGEDLSLGFNNVAKLGKTVSTPKALKSVEKGYIPSSQLTPEELSARQRKRCATCGNAISGWSPYCASCNRERKKQEPAA